MIPYLFHKFKYLLNTTKNHVLNAGFKRFIMPLKINTKAYANRVPFPNATPKVTRISSLNLFFEANHNIYN